MNALTVLRLIATAVSPAIMAILLHFLLKKWKWFGSRNYWVQQLIIGGIFTCLCLCSFYFGVEYKTIEATGVYEEVVGCFGSANASPLIAGLAFGGPSGFITGLAAGIFRLFLYPWGSGDWLRGAESISVFLAGSIAWVLRIALFDDKKPKWYYGFIAGIMIETIHMLLIFAFAIYQRDAVYAYGIIRTCDIACASVVSAALVITLLGISFIEKEKIFGKAGESKKIASKIQKWLGVTFIVAITFSFVFTYLGNYQKTSYDCENALVDSNNDLTSYVQNNQNITQPDDVTDIAKVKSSGAYYIASTHRIGKEGYSIIIDTATEKILSVPNDLSQTTPPEEFIGKPFSINGEEGERSKLTYYKENEINLVNLVDTGTGDVYAFYFIYSRIAAPERAKAPNFTVISFLSQTEARLELGLTVRLTSYMELLIFIAVFAVIYIFIKRVVVLNVIKINNSLDKITGGNLNVKVNVRSNQEFSDLSDDINQTVDTLKRFIDEANKRIDKELKFAKEIQASSLPTIFPVSNYYDLHATMNTAKQVGGDFYDFFEVNKDMVFFSIADVSGKGIPAALFMMKAKTLIKSLIQTEELTLDNIITLVNDELNDHNDAMMFVTAWFGLLNLKTGHLEFVNAGHNPPIIKMNGEPFKEITMKKNFVLAGIDNFKYQSESIDLKAGDEIILYTDGVTEATNAKQELYGTPRFLNLLNNSKYNNATELTEIINNDLKVYQGDSEQADDITMVVVRYKKQKPNN